MDGARRAQQQLQLAILEAIDLMHGTEDRAIELPRPEQLACGADQVDAMQAVLHQRFERVVGMVAVSYTHLTLPTSDLV